MGAGLAALAGLLGGAGKGFGEGIEVGLKQDLADRTLAESQRHAKTLEDQAYLDLDPQIASSLGLPAGRQRKELLPLFEKLTEKQAARDLLAQQSRAAATAIGQSAQAHGTQAQPIMSDVEGTSPAQAAVPHPDFAALQTAALGGVPAKDVMETYRELLKSQTPKTNTNVVQGAEGPYLVAHDQAGKLGAIQPIPIGVPSSRNADLQTIHAAMQAEGTWGKPGDQRFDLEARRRFQKIHMAPPGGELVPHDTLIGAGTPGAKGPGQSGQQQPGQPPYVYRNAPAVSEGTANSYAAGKMAVEHMEGLSNDITRLAPDAKTRVSLAVRSMLQGIPILNAQEHVTPEEQAAITRLQHLQIRYENAMGGLRAAGSPQFYDRMKKIFGGVDQATVVPSLRALAGELRGFLETVQTVEGSQGKKPLPNVNPAPRPVTPAAADTPWTDMGNGVRIRQKR